MAPRCKFDLRGGKKLSRFDLRIDHGLSTSVFLEFMQLYKRLKNLRDYCCEDIHRRLTKEDGLVESLDGQILNVWQCGKSKNSSNQVKVRK